MWKQSLWSWIGAGALSASLPLVGLAQDDDPAPQQPRPAVRALRVVAKQLADGKEILAVTEDGRVGEYWIGIGIGELTEIVKDQLGLQHGLVVDDVMPDSPALQAGLQKNDILVKVGDKPLAEPADLIQAVEEAKENKLAITLMRGGKEMTLQVTPAKRPAPEIETRVIEFPSGGQPGQLQNEIKRLEEALKALREKGATGEAGILFARPGVVAAKEVVVKLGEFPKDLSIQINKEGNKPAKIHVKKGDKEWDVTEDKLGELPDDIRPHVQRVFGGARMTGRTGVGMLMPHVLPQTVIPAVPPVATPAYPGSRTGTPQSASSTRGFSYRLESRGADEKLDEIMKELKALRKDVDELRGKATEK